MKRFLERTAFGWASLTPAWILMAVFLFAPIVIAIWLSFMRWNGLGDLDDFVGLENYQRLLNSKDLGTALGVNLAFGAGMVPLTVGLGFGLAAIVHYRLKGWRSYRAIWFFPVLMPGTVVSILWATAVLGPNTGLAEEVLKALGQAPPQQGILGTPGVSMVAIILVSTWAGVGVPFIILLAGMERIPGEIYEAAKLDGASQRNILRYFTLPLTLPVVATVALLQVIYALRVVDIFFIMTGGGPGRTTTPLGLLIYEEAFKIHRFGVAAALSVLMLAGVALLGLLMVAGRRVRGHAS